MTEQTAVEPSIAAETFRQWHIGMQQRIDATRSLNTVQIIVELPSLAWAAMKGAEAIESHGDPLLTQAANQMLNSLLSAKVCDPIRDYLDQLEDSQARARRMNRPPDMAALMSRIDRLAEIMAAPAEVVNNGATKQARRVIPLERLGNIAQRVVFANVGTPEKPVAFQYLGNGTIAVPHREDGDDAALVMNFGSGTLALRRLPDTTPVAGQPFYFGF